MRFGFQLLGHKDGRYECQQPEHRIAADLFNKRFHGAASRSAISPPFVRSMWCWFAAREFRGVYSARARDAASSALTLTAATRPVSTMPEKPIINARKRDTTWRGVRSPYPMV